MDNFTKFVMAFPLSCYFTYRKQYASRCDL